MTLIDVFPKTSLNGLLLVLLVLSGCVPESHSSSMATITPATLSTRPWVAPSPLSLVPPTLDQATAVTSPTILPAATPSRPFEASTPEPDRVDVPSWLADDDTRVVAAVLNEGTVPGYMFSLLSAGTGQRYDIPASQALGAFGWACDAQGCFFMYGNIVGYSGEYGTMYSHRVYVTDGTFTRVDAPRPQPTPFVSEPTEIYRAAVVSRDTRKEVWITDTRTGQATPLEDPFGGQYADDVVLAWSPDGEFLAVTRRSDADTAYVRPAGALVLYSKLGQIYRVGAGIEDAVWPPEGSDVMLVTDGDRFDQRTPCILLVSSMKKNCLDKVTEWRDDLGIRAAGYQWAGDAQHLGFVYWGRTFGGLCIVNVEGQQIDCPVTDKQLGTGRFVVAFKWSQRGDYVWMLLDVVDPMADEQVSPEVATSDRAGHSFRVWGNGLEWSAWRP